MQKIFTPYTVGSLTFKNRMGLAPLTRGRADPVTGCVKDIHATYYSQRASGGYILTEATGISRQGLGWYGAPGVYTDAQVEAWKPVTKAVHDKKGIIICQLWHMGRTGHSDVFGSQPVSSCEVAIKGEVTARAGEKKPYEVPRMLTTEEVEATVKDYAIAAKNALAAGFDGVQIHSANGYLPDQFLQAHTNTRTDKYGGSIENRVRFVHEIIQAIAAVVPRDRIWIRFSPNGAFSDMGHSTNIETFDAAIKAAASEQIGCIEVMDGLGFGFHQLTEPYTLQRARDVVKSANPSGTTAICGNVGYTLESASAQIEAGHADFISFGRSYMSNPDLPERFKQGVALAPPPEYPDWWTKTDGDGYITFPRATKEE